MRINKAMTVTLAALAGAAAVLLTGDLTAQQRPAGPFTAAQVAQGKQAYEANCASCHLPTLAGSGDASPLAGTGFMAMWGARTAGQPAQLHSGLDAAGRGQQPGRSGISGHHGLHSGPQRGRGGTAGAGGQQ